MLRDCHEFWLIFNGPRRYFKFIYHKCNIILISADIYNKEVAQYDE